MLKNTRLSRAWWIGRHTQDLKTVMSKSRAGFRFRPWYKKPFVEYGAFWFEILSFLIRKHKTWFFLKFLVDYGRDSLIFLITDWQTIRHWLNSVGLSVAVLMVFWFLARPNPKHFLVEDCQSGCKILFLANFLATNFEVSCDLSRVYFLILRIIAALTGVVHRDY